MQSSVDILNAVAKKLGGVTDYRIAKDIGIHQATISSVRAGRCSLSRENCAKAAEVLGVEVGALIAIATAEREENPDIRRSLLRVARKGMATAALVAAIGLSAAPAPPAQASTAPQQGGNCLLCKLSAGRCRCERRNPQRAPSRTRRRPRREIVLTHSNEVATILQGVTPGAAVAGVLLPA